MSLRSTCALEEVWTGGRTNPSTAPNRLLLSLPPNCNFSTHFKFPTGGQQVRSGRNSVQLPYDELKLVNECINTVNIYCKLS